MNQSPRTGFRLIRKDGAHHNADSSLNSVHYTRFQAFAFAAALSLVGLLTACASQPKPQVQAQPAPVAQPAKQPPKAVELAPRAPERYVVKKGDTLWDISTIFLRDPWLWPEIWYVNPQINNPHLIYPGDIITIFWHDGRPQLRIEREGEVYQTTLPIERLSPQVRTLPLEAAIPTIPLDAIRPFLSHPRIVNEDEYEELPYILRSQDGRLLSGAADAVYARRIERDGPARYHVIRIGDRYQDPETGEVLGYEAIEIGQAAVRRHGDPATLFIESSKRESMKGDRLVPVEESEYNVNFLPHAPSTPINGQIIDVVDGVEQVGQYQVVTLNRGTEDGLEVGHVLDVYQRGAEIEDDVSGSLFNDTVRLPDERAGTLLVFRAFDRVSYGLIMHATREIYVLDMVRNP